MLEMAVLVTDTNSPEPGEWYHQHNPCIDLI